MLFALKQHLIGPEEALLKVPGMPNSSSLNTQMVHTPGVKITSSQAMSFLPYTKHPR